MSSICTSIGADVHALNMFDDIPRWDMLKLHNHFFLGTCFLRANQQKSIGNYIHISGARVAQVYPPSSTGSLEPTSRKT